MSVSTTTYTTVNGLILRQVKDGVVHNFVSDPLGSVVMVRDTSGNTVYEAEYDPYGNVQSETGINPYEFGYVGTLGYVKDSAFSLYVRARYLLTNLGRWLTKDPLWPSEPGFVYAGASPTMNIDPSGNAVLPLVCLGACVLAASCALGVWIACKDWQGAYGSFAECASDFISTLPPHSQAGCLAGVGGCFACLAALVVSRVKPAIRPIVRYVRNWIRRWKPRPVLPPAGGGGPITPGGGGPIGRGLPGCRPTFNRTLPCFGICLAVCLYGEINIWPLPPNGLGFSGRMDACYAACTTFGLV